MHRLLLTLCCRNIEYKHFAFADNSNFHIFLLKQAYIDSILISCTTPKILLQFVYVSIGQAVWLKFAVAFLHPKNDSSTLRVGKSRIGFPKVFRKTSER